MAGKKKSPKKTPKSKMKASKKKVPKKQMPKKKAKASAAVKRARPAPRKKAQRSRARPAAPPPRRAAVVDSNLESAEAATGSSRLEALQDKLGALARVEAALRARLTHTPEDDEVLNPTINAIVSAQRTCEAEIAAAQTPTLAGPSEADVTRLRDAIREVETVVAQNAAVNQLVQAATALARTLGA